MRSATLPNPGRSSSKKIEFGDLDKTFQQSTSGAHFVGKVFHTFTSEIRVRRMLAVCAADRILNPKAARSHVIGAMTIGVGGALMEELAVDNGLGFFVNHDLAGYEVPVCVDIPISPECATRSSGHLHRFVKMTPEA